jgi:hypothetical protein
MIVIQVIAKGRDDAYNLLRKKVTHEAKTWSWSNKAKTRLVHAGAQGGGYIEIARAGSVLVAEIRPREKADEFFLVEKFIGRLTAWFSDDLVGINLQFTEGEKRKRRRRE